MWLGCDEGEWWEIHQKKELRSGRVRLEEMVERKVDFPGPSPSSTYFGSSFAGFSFKACSLLLPIGRLQGVL